MALATGTIFELNSSGANTNGAGFNTGNANFMTDLACDTNTGNTNSPVVSSATYSFVAGDVGARVYIKSGTNWTPGFYYIASVAGGKATLNASVGTAEQLNASTGLYQANTVAGCATTGTPTGGTFGVDYSCLTTAPYSPTSCTTSGAGSTTLTKSSGAFTKAMIGNLLYIASGTNFQTGWYEISNYTDASNVVLDRTPSSGGAGSNGSVKVSGAFTLTANEDAFFEAIPAGSLVYIKGGGTYTLTGAINVASTNSTSTSPSNIIGFNSLRGDTPTYSQMPIIAGGANATSFGQYQNIRNVRTTTTAANGFVFGAGTVIYNCSCKNKTTTANKIGFNGSANADITFLGCESTCNLGIAYQIGGARSKIIGSAARFSDIGISLTTNGLQCIDNIIEGMVTRGIDTGGTTGSLILDCTIYGREGKMGTGLYTSSGSNGSGIFMNNIFYGLTTGILGLTTLLGSNMSLYNDFYNNTTDVTLANKSPYDLALDPQFTGATQITGTTASGSGSVLTDTNADFSSVEDNVDYVYVASGTGATVGFFQITGHTSTTLTCDNAVGTNATANRVYYVFTGHNFGIGTNLKAQGFPETYMNTGSTDTTISYLDTGAAQRQETGGSSAGGYTFGG